MLQIVLGSIDFLPILALAGVAVGAFLFVDAGGQPPDEDHICGDW